ncbi:MAG: ribosome silencing factor [Alphaproteobacteria bacterium]|nr:ribosome silencing factor [Alphaproteobacteria bacterium]
MNKKTDQIKEKKIVKKRIPKSKKSNNDNLIKIITSCLEDNKAENITIIDLIGKTSIADFMVVANGTSTRHLISMADHLAVKLKGIHIFPVHIEGKDKAEWILIDAKDVIIHLFRPDTRNFYNLEKMWGEHLPE